VSTPQQLSAFNNFVIPRYTIKNISAGGSYTVTGADNGVILNFIGSVSLTLNLAPAASLGPGFNFQLWNSTGGTTVTVDPNGAEYINGTGSNADSTYIMYGGTCQFTTDGVRWRINNFSHVGTFGGSVVIGNGAYGTNNNTIAIGNGAAATSPSTIAIGYGAQATNSYTTSLGYGAIASSTYSTAIGMNSAGQSSQAVTGAGAVALGGSYASGIDSFAAAIGSNLSAYGSTGGTGPVAIGNNNKASGGYSTSIGGYSNIGSANWSMALGGRSCTAAYEYSIAYGYAGTPNAIGKVAFGHAAGIGAGIGWGTLNLYRATTDATATILTSDNAAAGATNQLVLPINSAYTFSIMVVARQSAAGGTASAAWKIEGLIRREGTAANTTLVASTVSTISNVPTWTIAVTADTTNGGLAITATGAAATNIRWVATAQTSEVTYA